MLKKLNFGINPRSNGKVKIEENTFLLLLLYPYPRTAILRELEK